MKERRIFDSLGRIAAGAVPTLAPCLALAQADADAPAAQAASAARLPHDLSLGGMILGASPVAQAVIAGLALASVLSWTAFLAKTVELRGRNVRLRGALAMLGQSDGLADASERAPPEGNLALLLDAARAEIARSGEAAAPQGILDRISLRFERIEAAAGRRGTGWIGLVGTIGATAPFVGLFGTVWGIMDSFIGISRAQTTNLAIVAPGIAEALLTTAIGLFAAIPAVIFYNLLSRSLAAHRGLVGDAAAEVLRLVSRDLDRPGAGR